MTIINRENALAFSDLLENGGLGLDVKRRLVAAMSITEDEVEAAEDVRTQFTATVDRALAMHDVLMLPTLPIPPLRLSEANSSAAVASLTRLVRPFNLSGHPAISLPLLPGKTQPNSLQLVGRKGEDGKLCAIASMIEDRIKSLQYCTA